MAPNKFVDILYQYWGYTSFREGQLNVIQSIYEQNDVFALMPTGGGKSICYQVPALLSDGTCLVITPLIALMQDQIQQLERRGIKALMVHSNMTKKEVDITLDNAIYGNYKFLYVSPERLQSRLFKIRAQKMKISFIAVDEAHCISEWGFDFRPAYRNIKAFRQEHPNLSCIALTATATPDVVKDIIDQLDMQNPAFVQTEFERKNLTYNAFESNSKYNDLQDLLVSYKNDSSIIYCGTRKQVKSLYSYLHEKGFSVSFYHGGLLKEEREERQKEWTKGAIKTMIATNAFGMGIDKSDVRLVIHYDIPETIENYFQEAGRAGRDGKSANAALFYNQTDFENLDLKLKLSFPPIETIKRVYNAVGNYFQIAFGAGKGVSYEIDLADFSEHYKFNITEVFHAFKFLALEGLIELSDDIGKFSKLQFITDTKTLYNEQVKNKEINSLILFILRTNMGVFDHAVNIHEKVIAQKTGIKESRIKQILMRLNDLELVHYKPGNLKPQILFLQERIPDSNVFIRPENYQHRKAVRTEKKEEFESLLNSKNCISEIVINYFGGKGKACGKCHRCLKKINLEDSFQFEGWLRDFLAENQQISSYEIKKNFPYLTKEFLQSEIRRLIDLGLIKYSAPLHLIQLNN